MYEGERFLILAAPRVEEVASAVWEWSGEEATGNSPTEAFRTPSPLVGVLVHPRTPQTEVPERSSSPRLQNRSQISTDDEAG